MNSLVVWYKEICDKYASQKRREHEYIVNYYYAHRIDPIITYFLDKLGFSPNGVTLLSLIAGLHAAFSIYTEQYLLAALFIQLHYLLDGADGNLARTYGLSTTTGKWLDIATDQIVRLSIFTALAFGTSVPTSLGIIMLATIYIDLLLVQYVITPYSRKNPLIRAKWKQWFLDRGLIPGFDIFTIYLLLSVMLILDTLHYAAWMIAVLKTLDWSYRINEILRTEIKTPSSTR